MKVLITGASGFVGEALGRELATRGQFSVVGCIRKPVNDLTFPVVVTGDLVDFDGWDDVLTGVDVVVHLAARAHVLKGPAEESLDQFRRVNVDVTGRLAESALRVGVKRFVYISSIGVNGAGTGAQPFTEAMAPSPETEYGLSKLEAENKLKSLLGNTDLELVVIRPPLVYAGNAPGNFRRLLKLVRAGLPMPVRRVSNQRSMLALENLVDFIVCCTAHEAAAGETFLVSDAEALSLPEILTAIGSGMHRPIRLFSVPTRLLAFGASLIGKKAVYDQLCGSLVVDASKARVILDWQPPVSPRDGLAKAGQDFMGGVIGSPH